MVVFLTFFCFSLTNAQCIDYTSATPYNSDNSNKGVMFNIISTSNTITITSFDFNMIGNSTGDFEIYYKSGGYQGFESDAGAWTLIGTATNVTALGTNNVSPIPLPIDVIIPAGQTYGFYVTNNNPSATAGIRYRNNSGPLVIASDANISIYSGIGKAYPFGQNYNNRSVNCTVHYRTGDKNLATTLAVTNASASVTNQNNAATSTYAADCSKLITKVLGSGASPISGNVTAKVWVESTQPATYVKRHYEILPTTNPTTATADVTLYFTQPEFDSFNAVSTLKLPTGPTDTTGKSNLLIELIGGSTSALGLPTSYTGASSLINPADTNIVWDAVNNYWKVTFSTTGFGGFFAKTTNVTLDLKDYAINPSLQIYPNPTNNNSFVTIDGIGTQKTTLEVINSNGKVLFTKVLQQNKDQINISDLSNDVYFFKIYTDKASVTSKIIKN
ncbi:MAG: hypothetical protein QG594_1718 [Bacteroidota bacterium]|nr:hypothetical protein [Bacteroidota bacterium]